MLHRGFSFHEVLNMIRVGKDTWRACNTFTNSLVMNSSPHVKYKGSSNNFRYLEHESLAANWHSLAELSEKQTSNPRIYNLAEHMLNPFWNLEASSGGNQYILLDANVGKQDAIEPIWLDSEQLERDLRRLASSLCEASRLNHKARVILSPSLICSKDHLQKKSSNELKE